MLSKKVLSSIALVIMFTASVFAENTGIGNIPESQGDPLNDTAAANKVRQPFSWSSAGDVLKYEIIIDRFDEGTESYLPYYYHETNEEETQACLVYIDPLLPVGQYRSEIKVYNILGILEESMTSHDEFTVRQAYKPEIRSVSYPLYMRNTIYLDDLDNDGIIEVTGRNLFLPDKTDRAIVHTKYYLKSSRTVEPLETLSHDEIRNRKIVFLFDMKKLDVGKYHFFAQDASGLHSEDDSDSEFFVKFKKWLDIDIEAGYTCPVVLHDETLPEYLDTKVFPLSLQGKFAFMPFKHVWGYMGLGIRGNYSRLSYDAGSYEIDGNLGMIHGLFIYQLPLFKRRLILELHGGAGITYFNNIVFHFPHNIDSDPLNTISLSFDAGLSVQIYINKRLYTAIGADYAFTLNKDMNLGVIMPQASIGWQF